MMTTIWIKYFGPFMGLTLLISTGQAETFRQTQLSYNTCGEYYERQVQDLIKYEAHQLYEQQEQNIEQNLVPLRSAFMQAEGALREAEWERGHDQRDLALLEEQITAAQDEKNSLDQEKADCHASFIGFNCDARHDSSEKQNEIDSLTTEKDALSAQLEQSDVDHQALQTAVNEARQALEDAETEANKNKLSLDVFVTQVSQKFESPGDDEVSRCRGDFEALWNYLQIQSERAFDQLGLNMIGESHETGKADLSKIPSVKMADLLPNIDSGKYKVVVQPQIPGAIVIEVYSSSEKAGTKQGDDLLIQLANGFNSEGRVVSGIGSPIQVRVRTVASGDGYEFIANEKYLPDVYSPSNELWVAMLEEHAAQTGANFGVEKIHIGEMRSRPALKVFDEAQQHNVLTMPGVVGNVAGIFMKKEVFAEKFSEGQVNACEIIEKAVHGEITIGYTNPYVSSTGLNFLYTALHCLADGRGIDAPQAVAAFRAFQAKVPNLYDTTLSLRESVRTGGAVQAGVIEHQSFVNTRLGGGDHGPLMSESYVFVPFGVRHENPFVHIVNKNLPEEERHLRASAARVFAEYVAKNRGAVRTAVEYGFFGNVNYQPTMEIPSGRELIAAQSIWKNNKTADDVVAAYFVGDTSGSMRDENRIEYLSRSLVEASSFIRPDMYVGLIDFNLDETRGSHGDSRGIRERLPLAQFNGDARARFVQAAEKLEPGGGTPLYTALAFGMKKLLDFQPENPKVKRVIFLLTDGEPTGLLDEGSQLVDILLLTARKMGIQIHSIALGEGAKTAPLQDISRWTDGSTFKASRSDELRAVMGRLFNSQL